jgi:hypothetical protein
MEKMYFLLSYLLLFLTLKSLTIRDAGTLHKTTENAEYAMYRKLANTEAAGYLPKLIDVKETLGE